MSDLSAGNALCQQDFELWKDKLNPYGTTAKFQYLVDGAVLLQHDRERRRIGLDARQCRRARGSAGHGEG